MTAWHHHAECDSVPLPVFFDPGHERLALSICADCPVSRECLEDVLAFEGSGGTYHRYGVVGGLTPAQRAHRHAGVVRP